MALRNIGQIIIRTATVMVVVLMLCLTVVLLYARSQGLLLLSVQTGSMRPAIRPGDAVLVRQGVYKPGVGDIVSYRSLKNDKRIITHRVVDVSPDGQQVTLRGDALRDTDPVVPAGRIVGKVEANLPYAGYGLSVLRHPAGLALAVYVPALIVIVWELRRLSRYYAARRYRSHLFFSS